MAEGGGAHPELDRRRESVNHGNQHRLGVVAPAVLCTAGARADLERLHDFLLDRAQTPADLEIADLAVAAIEHAAVNQLARTPFIFRRAGTSITMRDLIIPFGSTGYVARYDIRDGATVVVLAFRHQREEDYF